MDGVNLITDPILRDRIWYLRRETPCIPDGCIAIDSLSAVLISHLHPDHTDMASLRRIPPEVPIIAPQGTGRYLRARLPHSVHTVAIGGSRRVGSVEIIAVPAAHSGPGPSSVSIAACAGYMLRGSQTIYFAGDTALFPGLAKLGEAYEIDLALLPIWGWGPILRGEHMSPADAARALALLRPRMAIPIHWGTFRPVGSLWSQMRFLSDPPYTFAGYAAQLAPGTQVHILRPQDSLDFEPQG
jgi:L-ascorbate metabolism protein UlaG (beta-lactamase superfamily)